MLKGSEVSIAVTSFKYGGIEVTIDICKPKIAFLDSRQFECVFSIIGGGIEYRGSSIGYDSMQALLLSLTKIGTYLTKSDFVDQSKVDWEGGEPSFPVFKDL